MRPRAGPFLTLIGCAFLAFLLLPLIALVTNLDPAALRVALTPGPTALGSALPALWTSLRATAVVLMLTVLFGTPLARTLSRARFPVRQVGELLLLIPLAMPPLVLGLLLVSVYGPYGVVGAGLGSAAMALVNSFWGLCLAQLYEAAPAYVLTAQAAFSGVDRQLEQTSWLLGRGPWQTFRRVTLPLAAPGLAAGIALATARALGAFGAVLVIAYHPTSLPLAVWLGLQERGVAQALPIALVLLVVTLPLPLAAAGWGYRAQRRLDLPPSAF